MFLLNGYDLERFKDIEELDLDDLGITCVETRAKLMTAAELLQDCTSEFLVQRYFNTL